MLTCAGSLTAANSLVQSSNGFTSSGTSATCVFGSNVVAGNLLVMDVMWGGAGVAADFTFSDTVTSSWNKFPGGPITQGNEVYEAIAVAASSAADTVTVSNTVNGNHTFRVACFEYNNSGVGWPSNAYDQTNSQTNASAVATTASPGASITPSVTGTIVHAAVELNTAGAISLTGTNGSCVNQPAGGSNGWHSDGRADSADFQAAGTSSTTCTFTWNTTSSPYAMIIASFKPSAGAAAPIRHRAIQSQFKGDSREHEAYGQIARPSISRTRAAVAGNGAGVELSHRNGCISTDRSRDQRRPAQLLPGAGNLADHHGRERRCQLILHGDLGFYRADPYLHGG